MTEPRMTGITSCTVIGRRLEKSSENSEKNATRNKTPISTGFTMRAKRTIVRGFFSTAASAMSPIVTKNAAVPLLG